MHRKHTHTYFLFASMFSEGCFCVLWVFWPNQKQFYGYALFSKSVGMEVQLPI